MNTHRFLVIPGIPCGFLGTAPDQFQCSIPGIPSGFLRNIPDLFLVYQGMQKEQSRNPQGMNWEKPQVKLGFLGMLCVHQDSSRNAWGSVMTSILERVCGC